MAEDKKHNYEELNSKYKQALEDLKRIEFQATELEEAFKDLTSSLVGLVESGKLPGLSQALDKLRADLKKKGDPESIDAHAKVLKNFVLQVAAPVGEKKAAPPEAAPESLEESVRDILVAVVEDVANLEEPEIQAKAKALIRRIRTEFKLDDFKPFVQEIQNLVLQIKEMVHREKRKIYTFTQEVISQLEDTEKDFIRNLDDSAKHIQRVERSFVQHVAGDLKGIEQSFETSLSLEQVRGMVLGKITNIRERLRRKRDEDEARYRRLEAEKAGVENSLMSVRQKYQDFTSQSRALMEQMEKLRHASMTDGLTGAYNRRAYDLQIKRMLEALRKGEISSFSLIVFDIDNFKDFNNSYGHRAGDLILRHVAKLTGSTIRKYDVLARFGGDEFAILLPEADLDDAARIAEKIRAGIGEVEFKIYRDKDITVKVGLSLGVGGGRPEDDPDALFHRTDQALYLAKESGRNQVRTERDPKSC